MPNRLNKKFISTAAILLILIGVIFARPINLTQAAPVTAAPVTEGQTVNVNTKIDSTEAAKKIKEANPNILNTEEQNKAFGRQADARKAASEPSASELKIPLLFHIISGILYAISFVLSHVLILAAKLANVVLSINHFTDVPVVMTGWEITRGLCNMIFALVLLILAFDTVLQTEYMGARRTLVRLVVIALLINFSLMFGGIIIDFSQVLTQYFITAAAGANGDVGLKLAGALKLNQLYQPEQPTSFLKAIWDKAWGPPLSMILNQLMICIVLLVAVFTFFAFSFFLLVRVVWLWLLLILAPLAWASYVAPNLASSFGGGWERWWKDFLKWSFFAPAYAFFLYLALTLAQNNLGLGSKFEAELKKVSGGNSLFQGFLNDYNVILQYIVVIAILLAGLQFAQKAGVYGANAVMSSVKKMGTKVGDWSKRQAKRPGFYALDKTSQLAAKGASKVFSKIPGLKTAGRRLEAKATQLRDKQAERQQHKPYQALLKNMSDDALLDEVNSAMGIRKLIAARAAQERGSFTKYFPDKENGEKDERNEKTREAAKTAHALFKRQQMKKEADNLGELRPDIFDNDAERKNAEKDAIASGNWKKWKAMVLDGEHGKQIMDDLRQLKDEDQLTQPEINSWYMSLYKPSQEAAQKGMKANFTDNWNDKKNTDMREIYAASVRKLPEAFRLDPNDEKSQNDEVAKKYIHSMTSAGIGAVSDEASLELIGRHMLISQMAALGKEASGKQKTSLVVGILQSGDANIAEHTANSPPWAKAQIQAQQELTKAIKAQTMQEKTKVNITSPPQEYQSRARQTKSKNEEPPPVVGSLT